MNKTVKKIRLNNIKNDLRNDNSSISMINRRIEEAVYNFQKFIERDNGTIVSKLYDMREPNQGADFDLMKAREYIQREINKNDRDIKKEKEMKAKR